MLDSTFALIGFFGLMAVILFFVNPLLAIIPLCLLVVPFALRGVAGMFKHVAPPAGSEDQPAVPSTSDAAYEPVSDPGAR